jgi:hypothetical protein
MWLPDAPGVLGTVAAAIGEVQGNVVGLEVLERGAGVAIDEFVIELPDHAGVIDALSRGVRSVPGAGVEEVTDLGRAGPSGGDAPDREDDVMATTMQILAGATPEAALGALTNGLISLFSLSWLALMDDALEQFVETHGDLPSVEWVVAFAEGARSGADPPYGTTGSGVFIESVPGSGLTVCGGRPSAIRRRERHEISMLVMVASRYIHALVGRGIGGLGGGGD